MAKLVMPKNSALIREIQPVLEIYYKAAGWLANDSYKEQLKACIGADQYPSSYTKKTQITSYFGFTEWEDITKPTSPRRMTAIGRKFYEALCENNRYKISEIILTVLETVIFGRDNCGCIESDTDIEAPCLFIRASIELNGLSYKEFAYLLWNLVECCKSYTDTIRDIIAFRKTNSLVLEPSAEKYKDAKPIMMLIRWGFLTESPKGIIVAPEILQRYKDRLESLAIYNIDKHKKSYTKQEAYQESSISNSNNFLQQIFIGAPGTGKSYMLNKEAMESFGDNCTRVTFHPNYLYSNFVGTYKPYPKGDRITYEYIPGPLMSTLVKSLLDAKQDYLLIVEEINRADVSSVFGDVFQLLDRKGGYSEYEIAMSREMRDYIYQEIIKHAKTHGFMDLNAQFEENCPALIKQNIKEEGETLVKRLNKLLGTEWEKIRFPSNFYIWATMNSADQGVKPMDSAFKRRWDFKYVGIDDGITDVEAFNAFNFYIGKNKIISWNEFRTIINEYLSNQGIAEDKLMGPYFISQSTLNAGTEAITRAVKNKVLMYLFEDAAKPYRSRFFNTSDAKKCDKRFSSLCQTFETDGTTAFCEAINKQLEAKCTILEENGEENIGENEGVVTPLEVADGGMPYGS